jgi:hypothetical protein
MMGEFELEPSIFCRAESFIGYWRIFTTNTKEEVNVLGRKQPKLSLHQGFNGVSNIAYLCQVDSRAISFSTIVVKYG